MHAVCADFLETVGEAGLWDLVRRYDDHSATAVCSMVAADLRGSAPSASAAGADATPPLHLFRGALQGSCVAPRGDVRHGARSWNGTFVPEASAGGDGRTFGEMSYEEQSAMSHRHAALKAFMRHALPPAAG